MEEYNESFVTLIDENGDEVKFEHLDTIEMNSVTYVVCVPCAEDMEEDDVEEVIIFKVENEDGNDILVQLESDDELDMVYEEFKVRNTEFFDFGD